MKEKRKSIAEQTQEALTKKIVPALERGGKRPRLIVRIKLSKLYVRKPKARRYEHKSSDGSYARKSITYSKKGYRVTFSKTFYLTPSLKDTSTKSFEKLLAKHYKARYQSFSRNKRYTQFSGNVQYFIGGKVIDPYTGRLSIDSQVSKSIPFLAVSKEPKKGKKRRKRVVIEMLKESEGRLLDSIPELFPTSGTIREIRNRAMKEAKEKEREKRKQERKEERETFMKKKKKKKGKKK